MGLKLIPQCQQKSIIKLIQTPQILDQKPVNHFFSTLSAGHELFQILPLRCMGSMAGPDSKHCASEICDVPVMGFQAYTDNNNGKTVAYIILFQMHE